MILDCIILFADLFLYARNVITAVALREFIEYHPSSYARLSMRDLESALSKMEMDGKIKPITRDANCGLYVKTKTYSPLNPDIVLQGMKKRES